MLIMFSQYFPDLSPFYSGHWWPIVVSCGHIFKRTLSNHHEAPSNHRSMSVENRAENVMSGFILLDVFHLLADRESARRGLPKGSLFLAPETTRNLQQVGLGILSVCLTKPTRGNPWLRGDHRLSELGIEHHFGRLRSQSPTAQLTTRSYWQSSARDMLRRARQTKPSAATRCVQELVEPLTPDEFYSCSERAYKSALRLAGFCEGVTAESLEDMYLRWCKDKEYLKEGPLLGDEEELDDSLVPHGLRKETGTKETAAKENGAREFLEQMQVDASLAGDLPETEKVPDAQELELKSVPDADTLRSLMSATSPNHDSEDVPPQSPSKGTCARGMAKNLHHALWGLGCGASEAEVFDSIWRLVMYLRHWGAGCDRSYSKLHPRPEDKQKTFSRFELVPVPWFCQISLGSSGPLPLGSSGSFGGVRVVFYCIPFYIIL